MCTVTLVPTHGGLRLVHNRDESRLRAPGTPPAVEQFSSGAAILPRDSTAGGTWVAVTDRGWVAALLNIYHVRGARDGAEKQRPSRGLIIPQLLSCENLEAAWWQARQLEWERFGPCRLILANSATMCVLSSDGARQKALVRPLRRPQLFTSSGLGDRVVAGPRRRLFLRLLAKGDTWIATQDEFHRHRWPKHPERSVWMSRADACTVSRTVLEVTARHVRLTYESLLPTPSFGISELVIPRAAGHSP